MLAERSSGRWVGMLNPNYTFHAEMEGQSPPIPREITLALGYLVSTTFAPVARGFTGSRRTAGFVKLPINVNASNNSSKLCFLRDGNDGTRAMHKQIQRISIHRATWKNFESILSLHTDSNKSLINNPAKFARLYRFVYTKRRLGSELASRNDCLLSFQQTRAVKVSIQADPVDEDRYIGGKNESKGWSRGEAKVSRRKEEEEEDDDDDAGEKRLGGDGGGGS